MFYTPENGGIEAKIKLLAFRGAEISAIFICPYMVICPFMGIQKTLISQPPEVAAISFLLLEHDFEHHNLLFDLVFFKIEISRFWLFFALSRKLNIKMQSGGCCQCPIIMKIGNFAYLTKPNHQKKGRIFSH